MNHRQPIPAINKYLPRLKRRDVAGVLEVMTELWLDELAQPGQTVTVSDLGKLVVEVQKFYGGASPKYASHAPKSVISIPHWSLMNC